MSFELPRDAEGREIPLDTVALFGGNGNVYNIARWIYTTDFETWSESNAWRAITENHRALDPELMYLTPSDSWEKLLEDLRRAIEIRNEFDSPACGYTNHLDDPCSECRFQGRDIDCSDKMLTDVASRIRKLRGED